MSTKNKENKDIELEEKASEVENQEAAAEASENQESAEAKESSEAKDEEKTAEAPKEPSLEEQIEELKKQALYKQAEFENFRKRTLKEKADLILAGGEKTIQLFSQCSTISSVLWQTRVMTLQLSKKV